MKIQIELTKNQEVMLKQLQGERKISDSVYELVKEVHSLEDKVIYLYQNNELNSISNYHFKEAISTYKRMLEDILND